MCQKSEKITSKKQEGRNSQCKRLKLVQFGYFILNKDNKQKIDGYILNLGRYLPYCLILKNIFLFFLILQKVWRKLTKKTKV